MQRYYYVYILAKARNSTFYTGVTNDLIRRMYEHKNDLADGFTKNFGIKTLVYFEAHENIEAAIWREKLIKKWKREYKLNVIEAMNPDWRDLYSDLRGCPTSACHPGVCRDPALLAEQGQKYKKHPGADAPLPDPAIQRGDRVEEEAYG